MNIREIDLKADDLNQINLCAKLKEIKGLFEEIKQSSFFEKGMDAPVSIIGGYATDYCHNDSKPVLNIVSASTMVAGMAKIISGMCQKGGEVVGDKLLDDVTKALKNNKALAANFDEPLKKNMNIDEGRTIVKETLKEFMQKSGFDGVTDPTFKQFFKFVEKTLSNVEKKSRIPIIAMNSAKKQQELKRATLVINGLCAIQQGFVKEVGEFMEKNQLNDENVGKGISRNPKERTPLEKLIDSSRHAIKYRFLVDLADECAGMNKIIAEQRNPDSEIVDPREPDVNVYNTAKDSIYQINKYKELAKRTEITPQKPETSPEKPMETKKQPTSKKSEPEIGWM